MTRRHEQTHPWLKFNVPFEKADPRLWLLLGTVQARIEELTRALVPPQYSKDMLGLYMARGVLATTAIEGNTLTESQVQQIIEGKGNVPPSQHYQQQQIENVLELYNHITEAVLTNRAPTYTPELIENYNRILLKDDPTVAEEARTGKVRQHDVWVGSYKGAPPEDCLFLMNKLCEFLNNPLDSAPGYELSLEVLRAILAHLFIAWIHPFGDGNGRTARAIELEVLLRAGVPLIATHLLSNHYNRTRDFYYVELAKSSLANDGQGDSLSFIRYALQGFIDGLDEQIANIYGIRVRVHWRDYVHRKFDDKTSPRDTLRKYMVLDLSERQVSEPIAIRDIPDLSPRLARGYAGKTIRTVQRDVKELIEMKLLVPVEGKKVKINLGELKPFIPLRRQNS